MQRVEVLTVQSAIRGAQVEIKYTMDALFEGSIVIGLPVEPVGISSHLKELLDLWGGAFLAQLCLAKTLNVPDGYDPVAWAALLPVVQQLYDVRAYRDSLPLMQSPFITGPTRSISPAQLDADPAKAVLLWSGGVDSTLADLLLKDNGYETTAVHVQLNEGAIAGETAAVLELARHFGREVKVVSFDFPEFLAIAGRFSNVIDHFPSDNAIPHGRELLLIPIALAVGIQYGAATVALGHEYNAWTRTVEYRGRTIVKCDTQSESANLVLDAWISRFFPSARVFSPIAPLSDYLKFKLLADMDVEALARTSACFWGRNCGVCGKCTLHYLLQRMLDLSVIEFEVDSLRESAILRRMVLDFEDRSQTNWREMQVALSSIVESGSYSASEPLLVYYAQHVLPAIADELRAIRVVLSSPQRARLVPESFRYGT